MHGDAKDVLSQINPATVSLIVTSPPYNVGKEYERSEFQDFNAYVQALDKIIGLLVDKLADDGSICWQVGNHVNNGEVIPLDIVFYELFRKKGLKLRNRVIWRFNFGLHSKRRFSGRYETLLWFTKSEKYKFNLDPVRIPQLYPGKRHSKAKGQLAGTPSGNPLGKNPSDFWEFDASSELVDNPIWDIPNVKANHPEKTFHPCQFPIELVERCVLALTEPGDLVLDPFVGTGATVIAALKHERNACGIDRDERYLEKAEERIENFFAGTLRVRGIGTPVHAPNKKDRVARIPEEWTEVRGRGDGKSRKETRQTAKEEKTGSRRKKKKSGAKSPRT